MASILAFRQRKRSATATPKQNPAPAEIIIFPGVRYERTDRAEIAPKWRPAALLGQFQAQPLPTV